MQRLIYYSQLRNGMIDAFQHVVQEDAHTLREEWVALQLFNVSVFTSDPYVCVYAEAAGETSVSAWDWPVSFDRYLVKWPTEPDSSNETLHRLSVPMIDVFHDGLPIDADSWHDNRHVAERIGSIARLKPEMVSSYIYYHYQRQEEMPDSFNSSYMIGAFGRILFSYYESPSWISTSERQGHLSTKQTPSNWHEVMLPHFELWEDAEAGKQLWRKMERIM